MTLFNEPLHLERLMLLFFILKEKYSRNLERIAVVQFLQASE